MPGYVILLRGESDGRRILGHPRSFYRPFFYGVVRGFGNTAGADHYFPSGAQRETRPPSGDIFQRHFYCVVAGAFFKRLAAVAADLSDPGGVRGLTAHSYGHVFAEIRPRNFRPARELHYCFAGSPDLEDFFIYILGKFDLSRGAAVVKRLFLAILFLIPAGYKLANNFNFLKRYFRRGGRRVFRGSSGPAPDNHYRDRFDDRSRRFAVGGLAGGSIGGIDDCLGVWLDFEPCRTFDTTD